MSSRWPAARDSNILFLDVETGGLSPDEHDIVEIACILTDPSGRKVIDEFVAKTIPERPVHPEAARINGYVAEKWAAEGIPLSTAMVKVLTMARRAMMACHNTPFDKGFVESAIKRCHQKWTGIYHSLDTVALSMPLLKAGLVENVKLTTLTNFFNIEHSAAHSALSDARACRELYLRLDELYGPAIESIRPARDSVGDTTNKLEGA